jgi:hypothetical protein
MFMLSAPLLAQSIPNWSAPPSWTPPKALLTSEESPDPSAQALEPESLAAQTASSPFPFVALTPCRIVDTRGGAPIQGGRFTADEIRTWTITGICGLPTLTGAVSLNITVTGTDSNPFGFVTVWPGGTPEPNVSTLNWSTGGVTESNAAIVALGTSPAGSIALQTGNAGADVIVDINGYYDGGAANTFLGFDAGKFTTTGFYNTGIGRGALSLVANGLRNTAIGTFARAGGLGGSGNIAVGFNAGSRLGGIDIPTGSNNIDIGNEGSLRESATIRIGTDGTHGRAFLAGVRGVTTGMNDAVTVLIDSNGQLGTISSSRRVKEEIEEMGDRTNRLLQLRPVTFRYQPGLDPSGTLQYGLIAEEVAEVFPELVVYDREGQPETVRYHVLAPMLLNELQKQHRMIQEQRRTIEEEREQIENLAAQLLRLERRIGSLTAVP